MPCRAVAHSMHSMPCLKIQAERVGNIEGRERCPLFYIDTWIINLEQGVLLVSELQVIN